MSYETDYAFYKNKFAQQQADSDAMNDLLGFPREDLAHAKAIERQLNKMRPTWEQVKADFRFDVAVKQYKHAINA